MLHINPLTHITTQSPISFPAVVPRRPAPPLVRSFYYRILPPQPVKGSSSFGVNNKTSGGGKGMSWFYEMEEEVREYEVDQFGVVNNAVYSKYGEYATFKLLDTIGFDADIRLAVSEMSIKYIAPLKRKDRYLVKVRVYDYSTTRFYLEDQIFKLPNHEPITRARVTLVLLDEELRPTRITPSMISNFNKFLLSDDQEQEI